MNWDIIEGQWSQFKGTVKAKWGKLTDQDLTYLGGKKDKLLGKIQELYGLSKDEANKQIDEFIAAQDTSIGRNKSASEEEGGVPPYGQPSRQSSESPQRHR